MFKVSIQQLEWFAFLFAMLLALLLPFAIPTPRTWSEDHMQTLRGRVGLFLVAVVILINLRYPGFFAWLQVTMHRAVYN